jgi:hypothetical protein
MAGRREGKLVSSRRGTVSFDGLSNMAEVWKASGGERRGVWAVWLMLDNAWPQWRRC